MLQAYCHATGLLPCYALLPCYRPYCLLWLMWLPMVSSAVLQLFQKRSAFETQQKRWHEVSKGRGAWGYATQGIGIGVASGVPASISEWHACMQHVPASVHA